MNKPEVTTTPIVEQEKPIPSFTISREKDGWYFITNFIKDNVITKVEKTGPTMRAIVVDEFKISVQRFMEGLE